MASSSSSGSRKYDVFLSFRGEDTRKNYVDHLYKSLSDQLIHTYKDDQTLPRGDSIGPSLLTAIEESKIAVVVFSENYADSSWCLDELEYIMKCRVWRGLMVIPIFYKVSPSDVRKLQGNFGRSFAKRKRDNSTKEESWKKAIVEACNISGWEPSHIANGHEAAGIKLIVDMISEKLFSIDEDVDDDLVGMKTRLQSLESKLDIGSGGVHMVGIWGVGGSGKTTLAYSAYEKFSHHFQAHCFINQIREESTKHDGLKKVQEKILSALLKTNVDVQSVEEGKKMIRRRLRRSNVLIVLDDVDNDEQIEALVGSHKWFGDGSRIIITTRDEHLIHRDKVKISHASLLSLISTYKDDESLPRGDSIYPSLLNAIEESQIAVIVFSENYADSSWCLDELVHIMKCREERKLIVLPVFYKVSPSDVRKLQGTFGRAFAKRKRDNSTKEESWKNAIVEACNISGWEPSQIANGHEAAGIKSIADTISEKLFSLHENVDEDLVGMKTRLQSLEALLDIESGGVHMVGIWGVGGSGKTTLAYYAYEKFSHHFQAHCFVDQIREESTKHDGLKKVQEKILSALLKTNVNVQSVEEGKKMIRRRLCRSNVLIVLDDVDKDEQLEALAGSHEWFGDGSRIIITTRDEHLLHRDKVKISHASLLSDDEAIQLFNRHALLKNKPPIEDYDTLSRRVISYANGLPLALKVLGSLLRGKDKKGWEGALEKMKNIPNPTIIQKLKISYDGLEPIERELFLDIACFHRGDRVDDAKEIFDACEFYPDIGIKVLIEKALITISDGKFEMHDLVQEMGHYIVRGQHSNNPEKHSRVWKYEEIVEMCSTDSARENNEIEAVSFSWSDETILRFGDNSVGFYKLVSNMKKLRLLIVEEYWSRDEDVEGPCFLSNELQYISWDNYPGSLFPEDFQPTKLVVLKLFKTWHKEVWQGYKRLPQLKKLIIEYAYKLVSTPNFDGLPCLEYLKLDVCESLEEIHPSLGNCNSLVYVKVSGCEKLTTFPTIICMKNLETLEISGCEALVEFPEIHASMDSLKMLAISRVGVEVLPASSIGHYCTNLTSLYLIECDNLKRIEGNFQALKHLEKLTINFPRWYAYRRLEKLPNDLFSVCNLKRLELSDCEFEDGAIPCDVGDQLFNLTVLDLTGNNFSRLPFSLLKLTCLKALNLGGCMKLLEFPELPSSVDSFVGVYCGSLESMGDFYKNCESLSQVFVVASNDVSGAEGLLQCMLHGKAINHHMILEVEGLEIPKTFEPPLVRGSRCRLQLPQNWYIDFSGFLMCAVLPKFSNYNDTATISLKHEKSNMMGMNVEPGFWKECDDDKHTSVRYVSNDSLRHTDWWDSNSNAVSFSFEAYECSGFGVKLVARENKSVITDSAKNISEFWHTDSSEFFENKDDYTFKFKIVDDTKSALKLRPSRYPLSHYL